MGIRGKLNSRALKVQTLCDIVSFSFLSSSPFGKPHNRSANSVPKIAPSNCESPLSVVFISAGSSSVLPPLLKHCSTSDWKSSAAEKKSFPGKNFYVLGLNISIEALVFNIFDFIKF
ncbi:hypothetical protein ACQ4LE_009280 [Meloidogyne hapla]